LVVKLATALAWRARSAEGGGGLVAIVAAVLGRVDEVEVEVEVGVESKLIFGLRLQDVGEFRVVRLFC
jgi:hypothetical protein